MATSRYRSYGFSGPLASAGSTFAGSRQGAVVAAARGLRLPRPPLVATVTIVCASRFQSVPSSVSTSPEDIVSIGAFIPICLWPDVALPVR